ncbi:hypothetical protein ODJ79_41860 [Actinoplanes sp. KI2]|uniref:hypothetical protein n=1 Tax=Actinoplanes sp. KI2 TaxID=2983315 RepID=UPI0021D5CD77|nr:hypothetical protein [Actinoplanes sp. KI2]MCU7730304.1 hypothetical protein [Actinoplanes sp. KI2]
MAVGTLVVAGGAALTARLAETRSSSQLLLPDEADDPLPSPRRYLAALLRLSLVLVPEYVLVVLLLGAFRGWLFPIEGRLGPVAVVVLVAAVAGTLVAISTAGEIPILLGLALSGRATGAIGALLVTLPAVGIPGMVLMGRALGWRATIAAGAVAAAGGLVSAGALLLLTR